MQGQLLLEVGWGEIFFQAGPENLKFLLGTAPTQIYFPPKARRGRFNVNPPNFFKK